MFGNLAHLHDTKFTDETCQVFTLVDICWSRKKKFFLQFFVLLTYTEMFNQMLWRNVERKRCTSGKPSRTCFSTRTSSGRPIMSWSSPARKPSKRWRLPPPSPTTTLRRVRTSVRPSRLFGFYFHLVQNESFEIWLGFRQNNYRWSCFSWVSDHAK